MDQKVIQAMKEEVAKELLEVNGCVCNLKGKNASEWFKTRSEVTSKLYELQELLEYVSAREYFS